MSTPTIMIIRHGEKPVANYRGIDLTGQSTTPPGSDSLIPQGWMRCGALGRFFVPQRGSMPPAGLAVPTHLYAAASAQACPARFSLPSSTQQPPPIVTAPASTHSLREQELLLAVSALSQIAIDATYAPGSDEPKLAATVAALPDASAALIAWEHHNIPKLALAVNEVLGAHLASQIPQKWDGSRFDLVWVFSPSPKGYTFLQIPQMLLPGDGPEPLPC
jgi:hypothetical protein